MKKLIAGNWKMNGSTASAESLIADIAARISGVHNADMVICPPFPYLAVAAWRLKGVLGLALGAQNCSDRDNGAYTGDVSAAMLKDMGCAYVILGHSERRQYHDETDALVANKAARASVSS